MAKVQSPVRGFNGLGPAGIMFKDGEAETDNPAALSYFRRNGYTVTGGKQVDGEFPTAASTPAPSEHWEPEVPGSVKLGAPLRDAAVDPIPSKDFLPPTMAGKADPHGPQVVSPGLHAVPPAPITPGPVAVDNPAEQEKIETAVTEAVLVGDRPATDAAAIAAQFRPNVTPSHPERAVHPHGPRSAAAPAASDNQDKAPAKGATKAAWLEYAVTQGMDRDEADAATKADLVKRFGG